jgi:hypothetical protein
VQELLKKYVAPIALDMKMIIKIAVYRFMGLLQCIVWKS